MKQFRLVTVYNAGGSVLSYMKMHYTDALKAAAAISREPRVREVEIVRVDTSFKNGTEEPS